MLSLSETDVAIKAAKNYPAGFGWDMAVINGVGVASTKLVDEAYKDNPDACIL